MSFTAWFADHTALALGVMVAGLFMASLARGYSGFGFSALLVASWSLVTSPAKAVALALVMEVTASLLQAVSIWKQIPWRRVGTLMAGAVIGTPAGVWLLVQVPERPLKFGIALFVLTVATLLLAGFRLKKKAGDGGAVAVGVVSGVANGAVAMGGLPAALFLAADGDHPARIRAASIAYIFLLDVMAIGLLWNEGLIGTGTFVHWTWAVPVLVLGMWLGTRHFLGATPESFRRVTLWLLVGLALTGIARALFGA